MIPRSFIDLNRDYEELDPLLIEDIVEGRLSLLLSSKADVVWKNFITLEVSTHIKKPLFNFPLDSIL